MAYKDLFFDLDRTLWDFDRNSAETLGELFEVHNLEDELKTTVESFIQTFRDINAEEWRAFRQGKKTKDEMRKNRFVQTFFHFGSGDWKKARALSYEYVETCPYKGNLIPGALELLKELEGDFSLHIITNGFSDIQRIKIKTSGIEDFFSQVVISDDTPYRKPEREIFLEGVKRANGNFKESLMIGDDWNADIQGARRAGMDQIFFNPKKIGVSGNGSATFEVSDLSSVRDIVRSGRE